MIDFQLMKNELKIEIPFDTTQVSIDEEIDYAIAQAKRKYSKSQPIQDLKVLKFTISDVTTLIESDYTTYLINIYEKIDENLIDIIYFKPIDEAKNDIVIVYPAVINLSETDLLNIWSIELLSEYLERFLTTTKKPIIRKGRYIPVKLNTYYICYYNVMRINDSDFYPQDYDVLKDIAKCELCKIILMNKKYLDACGVKSVSISGISVNFAFPNREVLLKRIDKLEKELIDTINEYYPVII